MPVNRYRHREKDAGSRLRPPATVLPEGQPSVQLVVQLGAQPGVQPAVKSIVQPVQPPGANPPEQKKRCARGVHGPQLLP